jgi:AAA domain
MNATFLTPADRLRPEAVRFLWEPWLPAGKLALLDGDPDTGKSLLTCDLAARLSRGELGGSPASVILVNAEDQPADTIVPRLIAAGADLARVQVWDTGALPVLPKDTSALREAVVEAGAALLVLDPLMAFLGRQAAANSDQSVRRALLPLQGLAAETGCAVLLVRHLTKFLRRRALYRGLGSIGIAASARSAMLVSRDAGEPDRRLLAATKTNLGPRPAAKAFRIIGAGAAARLEWLADDAMIEADDLVRPTEPARAGWLRAMLAKAPRKAAEVESQAAQAGISWRTLQRAKADVGVLSEKWKNEWYWLLPGQYLDSVKLHAMLPPLPLLAE